MFNGPLATLQNKMSREHFVCAGNGCLARLSYSHLSALVDVLQSQPKGAQLWLIVSVKGLFWLPV